MSTRRLIVVEVLLFFFSAAIVGRLFYWQIFKHESFSALAKTQIENTVSIGAERGKILASDGSILVSNQKAYLAYVVLPEIKKLKKKNETYGELTKRIVDSIAPILLEEK